ncbi:hypothetical protein LY90DRAFT_667745 [Neocallimastix californiae]|uniref:Uncharacterized protein n=1 Tax=Neocallimastix californiae TaxID=1754190 RepID=A0A1Y2E8L2_9FUNG|nr:hypothetical protein LY90DRAFT_667745 [Neocallimastix californiae]|eukprot:ORY67901.1 hypothetical protein LY90DRAFT_667745 [Neocallimastix californiae]
MGVQRLKSYINNNIIKIEDKNKETTDNIVLIVDGTCLFYIIGKELIYFFFDYKKALQKYEEIINNLLHIDNLKKLIFVVDTVEDLSKLKKKRFENKFKSVYGLKEKIFKPDKEKHNCIYKYKYFDKYCPSPIEFNTYIHYLYLKSKEEPKLELKFPSYEADRYMAKLAVEENGDDSDFFIYDIPGYVSSLEDVNKVNKPDITKLYTTKLLEDYFGFNKKLFPLFASLSGNDYIPLMDDIIEKLEKYYDDDIIKDYIKNNNDLLNKKGIENENNKIYKSFYSILVKDFSSIHKSFDSFIKMFKEINTEYNNNDNKQNYLKEILKFEKIKCFLKCNEKKDQGSIIKMILECVSENKDEFKNSLSNSLSHYKIDNEQNDEKDSLPFSEEILDNLNHGKINSDLFNIIKKEGYYICAQYLEIIDEGNCYDVTDELRKEMYKLLICRNEKGIGENPMYEDIEKTITEYKRHNNKYGNNDNSGDDKISIEIKYEMKPSEITIKIPKEFFIPSNHEKRLELYLEIFDSNIPDIKKLDKSDKFLIPLVSSLRYYYKYYNNQKNKISSKLFIEELIASSIAALTLTYLNINCYKNNKDTSSLINKNRLEIKEHLKLTPQKIFRLMKKDVDNSRFKRETQILAEFRNVLAINSNIMQILKLTDDTEYRNISTMHHYIWEQAFDRIIFEKKKIQYNKHINIQDLFKNLFYIDKFKIEEKYLEYLDEKYNLVKKLILNNRNNDMISLRPNYRGKFQKNIIYEEYK